jgi:hypothetical protein
MSKNDEQKESPKHTQFYIKDIQFTELNNHVGWTTEIIYVNKVGHVYITFHTGLGGKHNHLCSFK